MLSDGETFSKSFEIILSNKDSLDKIYNSLPDEIKNECNSFETFPRSKKMIKLIAPMFLQKIKRPQIIREESNDYYIAYDEKDAREYICYKNLLCVDIDKAINFDIDNFRNSKYLWRLIKTNRGYHCFLVSEHIEYRSDKMLDIMLEYKSDYYYTIFSYLRGFCVRLNKKEHEEYKVTIYKDCGYFGNGTLDSKLDKLVNLHLHKAQNFCL